MNYLFSGNNLKIALEAGLILVLPLRVLGRTGFQPVLFMSFLIVFVCLGQVGNLSYRTSANYLAGPGVTGGRTFRGQSAAILNLRVTDVTDAVVVGATVTIKGEKETRDFFTGIDGVKLGLPSGIYRMNVRQPGFCRHEADFRIQPSIEKFITIQLVVCPSHGDLPFSRDSFAIGSSDSPLNLLIRFIKKTRNKDIVQYEIGEKSRGDLPKVIASYDSLTIYAQNIKFAIKKLQLEAEGDVVVENNGKRTTATRLLVDFTAKDPSLTATP